MTADAGTDRIFVVVHELCNPLAVAQELARDAHGVDLSRADRLRRRVRFHAPGAEKAIEACDYLSGAAQTGDRVIIIGGGLTGCEIALDLSLKGKTPVIVEMKHDLMAVRGLCLANSSYLRDYFALNGTEIHLNTTLAEVTDTGVIVRNKDGRTSPIDGDTVLLSVGYLPDPLIKKSRRVRLVGDCKDVGNLRTVIWRAWDAAMAI